MDVLLSLVILLPLAGMLLLLAFGKRIGEPGAGVIATLTVGAAFVIALILALDFFTGTGEAETVRWFEWLPAFGVEAELRWDQLSALMTLVVTGVGGLIHLYSIGYMHGDAVYGRFFTYLNLFIFSMLTLVLGNNFAVLFVGLSVDYGIHFSLRFREAALSGMDLGDALSGAGGSFFSGATAISSRPYAGDRPARVRTG